MMRISVIVNAPFGHRERVWSERSDAGVCLLGGDGCVLPFGGTLEGYLVRPVDDPVNYGVSEGRFAEQLVPMVGINLAGHDGGAVAASVLQDF